MQALWQAHRLSTLQTFDRKAFQQSGHIVGMCGDGADDAPALCHAQIGIAVFTATDAAKSAAGMVLTEPGQGGIVAAVKEGRVTFQRILTYTLYAIHQRRRWWGSCPSLWLVASSVTDVVIAMVLAVGGIAMTSLPVAVVAGLLAATVIFAAARDVIKIPVLAHLRIA